MSNDFLHRTKPLLKECDLERMRKTTRAIAGLGGVGGGAFLALVRLGFRKFRLAENGVFDPPDMNRQAAAFGGTMGRPKLDVYIELARSINEDVEIRAFPEGITMANLAGFLDGCDAHVGVIDVEKGADLKAATPALLRRYNIPLFTAGAVGMGALMVNHAPEGMMPEEFWALVRSRSTGAAPLPSFIAGLFSPVVTERLIAAYGQGIVATTSVGGGLSGLLLAAEIAAYVLKAPGLVGREVVFAPRFTAVDLFSQRYSVIDVTK